MSQSLQAGARIVCLGWLRPHACPQHLGVVSSFLEARESSSGKWALLEGGIWPGDSHDARKGEVTFIK